MQSPAVSPSNRFRTFALERPSASNADILNSANITHVTPPATSDVTAIGGGIHSLIYAIQLKQQSPHTDVSVLERSERPGYKIGESTLTPFGLWLRTLGVGGEIMGRLFGVKDGLAFYWLTPHDDPKSAACGWEDYTTFAANGPRGDFVPTSQMERRVSELLLTMYAQRMGVNVFHGQAVDVDGTQLSGACNTIPTKNTRTSQLSEIRSKLLVDATGRFRRYASKAERVQRFEGWNTNAYWAYFEETADETEFGLRDYESTNTNHICIPEGWAWIIRLPSWEESPLPNIMDMISYLLDLAEANTPGDAYPSAHELARIFDLKLRWIVSIGFALRSDTVYPPSTEMTRFGSCEAEQRFNYIVHKYPKMQGLMNKHVLLHDVYGPKLGTWHVRRQLAFASPVVRGPGWVSIGDAVGFTNPLYSPGINCGMATALLAAESTPAYLNARTYNERTKSLDKYDAFVKAQMPGLDRLNKLNYALFRHPSLGPLGPLWQYLCGTGNADWQSARAVDVHSITDFCTGWTWGARKDAYVRFADAALPLLQGAPHEKLSKDIVRAVHAISERGVKDALACGEFKHRWDGLLRWYDDDLCRSEMHRDKDILARRCRSCKNWWMCRSDWRMCGVCGAGRSEEDSRVVLVGELRASKKTSRKTPLLIKKSVLPAKDVATPSSPIVAIKMAPVQGERAPVQNNQVEVMVTRA